MEIGVVGLIFINGSKHTALMDGDVWVYVLVVGKVPALVFALQGHSTA
jgi:hypothetical protein